jgi:hypothetical protein
MVEKSRRPAISAHDGFGLAFPVVIASEAKQSRATSTELDCFVASLLAKTSTKPA